jgi:hypothetical protein
MDAVEAQVKWSENTIARALARQTFERKHLVLVPRCNWTGHECDLLVVARDLRIIDVEIKISRADLKADAKKEKWFHAWDFKVDGPYLPAAERVLRPRQWPRKVWKHYYCMPREIWNEALFEFLPSPASGVLLLSEQRHGGQLVVHCERRATPCRDADRISAEDAIDIARLASLRMWDSFERAENAVRPVVLAESDGIE